MAKHAQQNARHKDVLATQRSKPSKRSRRTRGMTVKRASRLLCPIDAEAEHADRLQAGHMMIDELRVQMETQLQRAHDSRVAPNGIEITDEVLDAYAADYQADPANKARTNALSAMPISICAEDREFLQRVNYTYSHTLKRVPRVTSQAHSGRCWLFAGLNAMRYYLICQHRLSDSFELSEAHLFFYDKLERANMYLESMITRRDLSLEDQTLRQIMTPLSDGGYWTYFVNLVQKYGVMPKSVYGECFNTLSTSEMNAVLSTKLAEFGTKIRGELAQLTDVQLRTVVLREMMPVIYQLVTNFMGVPPTTFDWNFNTLSSSSSCNRDGKHHVVKDITPTEFYRKFVEPHYDVAEMVLLRNDPRATSEFNTVYALARHSANMVGGKREISFNVTMETMREAVARSIRDDTPVWFACDVGQDFNPYYGVLAVEGYDYKSAVGLSLDVSKADALDHRVGYPTHAMSIVGMNVIPIPTPTPMSDPNDEGATDCESQSDLDSEPEDEEEQGRGSSETITRLRSGKTVSKQSASQADESECPARAQPTPPIPPTQPIDKWRVENSWGEVTGGEYGYLQMTDKWFSRHGYEAVVRLKYLPKNLQRIYQAGKYSPLELPHGDVFAKTLS